MATDANNPKDPDQEPESNTASPDGDADDGVADQRGSDSSRMMALPAEFVASLPPEILESLPPDIQANLAAGSRMETHTSITLMSMMMGRIVNPIADKVTEQHITDIIDITSREIDYANRQSERGYSDQRHARNWSGVLAVIIILALTAIAAILIFQGLLDFLREMAMLIIPLLGGIGIGIAIGIRIGIRYANSRGRQ